MRANCSQTTGERSGYGSAQLRLRDVSIGGRRSGVGSERIGGRGLGLGIGGGEGGPNHTVEEARRGVSLRGGSNFQD